jgi:hypothetical protein
MLVRTGLGMNSPTLETSQLRSKGDEKDMQLVNEHRGPTAAHATKWTVVVDLPRATSRFRLFDTQAEAAAEFVRLREGGIAHVYVLPPVETPVSHPTVDA